MVAKGQILIIVFGGDIVKIAFNSAFNLYWQAQKNVAANGQF